MEAIDAQRRLLKIAGILYGLTGILFLFSTFFGAFLIAVGVYVFAQAYEDEETIYKNRILLFILSILGFVNVIGFILVFLALDEISNRRKRANGINAPPKVVYRLDKESRKIDILLKLGVGMVFISGLLFATTSWDFINNYIKAFALIAFGGIFLALSLFTEIKLKLYRSSYMYWLLSMSLFLLTIVGMLYFGLFGEYLTYKGEGHYLVLAITYITGAGFALTTYLKFPKKYLLLACYAGVFLAISSFVSYVHLSSMMNVAIISIVVMITNIINKKKGTIHIFSTLLSYLLFGFILRETDGQVDDLELLIACIINIANLNYLTFIHKKEDESFINMGITYFLILLGINHFTPLGDCRYLMSALVMSTYSLLVHGNVIPAKKGTQIFNYIVYSFIMVILFLVTINARHLSLPSTYIFIPIIHLGINTLIKRGLLRIESWKGANILQPFLLLELASAFIMYYWPDLEFIYVLAVLGAMYGVLHFIYKISHNQLDKNIQLIALYLITFFSLQYDGPEIIPTLVFVLYGLYLFTNSYLDDDKSIKSRILVIGSYIMLLSTLYFPFVGRNILDISIYYPALTFIVLVLIIAPLLKDKGIQKTSYLYIVLPLLTLVDQSDLGNTMQNILESILVLYIVFLIIKFFIKNATAKNIIIILGVVYALSIVFFVEDLLAALYVGIIGLTIIVAGYRKDDMFPVFITGIIITALNIIYRLRDVWKQIPFWLYLLLGGLAIIGFVTYREIKKQKKS